MNGPDRWIVVTNWDRFQHPDVLRSSRPTWIKVYTDLLYDNDFLGLTDRRRGILFGLWLLYASSHGQVAVNTRRLSGLLHGRVTVADLKALNEAGFIDFVASKPQAHRKQPASLEKRREENPPTPLTGTNRNNGRQRTPKEEPTMVDVVTACQHFIEGHAWDETFDEHAIREEFGRIERARRTVGFITETQMHGLLEQWAATRQDRHGIPANLGAA